MQFADLGLVVVDEQHRFGVEQRAALTDKAGTPPHVLVMTATPIPRTVAMTVFGDLEISTLTELPGRPGADPDQRRPPRRAAPAGSTGSGSGCARRSTRATRSTSSARGSPATSSSRARATQLDVDDEGDRSPTTAAVSLTAVEEVVDELAAGPLRRAAGRRCCTAGCRPDEKDRDRCAPSPPARSTCWSSTTVIEVGVDVANATTMVLLDADRFGVSQLHQLRGRVGRGGLPGPVPAGHPRRGRHPGARAARRGRRHHRRVRAEPGRPRAAPRGRRPRRARSRGCRSSLQNLRVLRDEETIVAAREAAEALLDEDPDLDGPPELEAAVAELEHRQEADFMEKS